MRNFLIIIYLSFFSTIAYPLGETELLIDSLFPDTQKEGSNQKKELISLPLESLYTEPIEIDSASLLSFKNNKQYDYYSFKPKGESLWSQFKMAILRWLMENVNKDITAKEADYVAWVITGIVLIVLLILLFVFKPSLFYINKKKKTAYKIEDEDISEMSFDQLIEKALEAQEYNVAIRWVYLYTLKEMQDRQLISWNVNKTINEYVRELKRPDIKPDFNLLSRLFLYVRYGNFEADEPYYKEVRNLSDNIIKCL